MYSNRPGEVVNIAATIQPNAGTPGTFLSDAIPLDSSVGRRLWATILTGVIGAGGTVTIDLVGALTSGGTYNITIPGSAIAADATGGNIHTITAGIDWITYTVPTAKFVKLRVVTATAATPIAAIVEGFDCSNNPPGNGAAAVTVNSKFGTVLA